MRSLHHLSLAFLLALFAGASLLLFGVRDTVTGFVRDEHGPLANARVRYQATSDFAMTDARGRFFLPRQSEARHITAARPGYFIAGRKVDGRPLDFQLRPLPAVDNEDYAWIPPGPQPAGDMNCVNCHAEIYREWQASSHAHSANGKFFRDLYAGTNQQGKAHVGWSLLDQYPEGAGVCSACHAPTARGQAVFDIRAATGVDADGVHCDLCHKIAAVDTNNVGLTHGRFGLELLRPSAGNLFLGPLDDVDRDEDAFAPVYRESRYCASCHEGTVFGVPVYSTYSEWLESPARRAGKQCQSCHMSPTGKLTNIAPGKGGVTRPADTLASHRFPGGTLEMLRRAVQVETTTEPGAKGTRVVVTVRATDVGHRVPTGFIDRHLILLVEGFTEEGILVNAYSGPALPGIVGNHAGMPGKLYAKRLVKENEKHAIPFWLGSGARLLDTRLRPGAVDRSVYEFAPLVRVRTRLLYRRFWEEVAESKGWSLPDVVVHDSETSCKGR